MSRHFRLTDYLGHMHEAATDARSFVQGMAVEDFLKDRRTQQAVVMSLLILGEATTKVMAAYPDHVARYPNIPWRQMRGMRNRIAHGYFEINYGIVWRTVEEALPALIAQLEHLLQRSS